MNELKFISVTF